MTTPSGGSAPSRARSRCVELPPTNALPPCCVTREPVFGRYSFTHAICRGADRRRPMMYAAMSLASYCAFSALNLLVRHDPSLARPRPGHRITRVADLFVTPDEAARGAPTVLISAALLSTQPALPSSRIRPALARSLRQTPRRVPRRRERRTIHPNGRPIPALPHRGPIRSSTHA